MKNQTKSNNDLICSICGNIYPIKVNRQVTKIKGFKYAYCFNCQKVTRHQTVKDADIYKSELERKDPKDYTKKDKILKRALKI